MLLLASIVLVSTSYVACGSADERAFGSHPGTGGQGNGGSGTGGGASGGTSAGGGGGASSGGTAGSGGSTKDSSMDAPDDGPLSNTG